MGFIYKVTNSINGKVYIGQTCQTIQKRWKQHVYQALAPVEYYKSLLHRAIKKYGEDAFTVEELEKCNNYKLDEREIFWINYYDSYNNGYNITSGGSGWRKCDDNIISELWNDGYSANEIADELNVDRSTVSNHLRNIGISKEETFKRGAQRASKTKAKPVYQYDADGNYVSEYSSIREAEETIGCKINVDAKHKLYGGSKWRRYKVKKLDDDCDFVKTRQHICKRESTNTRKIHQYSLNGEYIQSFNSIMDACDFMNCDISHLIIDVCAGRQKQTHGYQWRYKKYDKIEPVDEKQTHNTKPVYQYSIDGEYIQTFVSSMQAAEILGCTSRSIRKACCGDLKQTGGYQWRHEKYDKIESIRNEKSVKLTRTKEVHQYTINGEYIRSFPSAKEATNFLNETNSTKIKRACLGDVKQAYGYKWSYIKSENYNNI